MKALLLSFIIYYLCFSDVKVGGANGTLLTDARLFLFQYTHFVQETIDPFSYCSRRSKVIYCRENLLDFYCLELI